MGQPLEITENDGRPEPKREPLNLFMHDHVQVVLLNGVRGRWRLAGRSLFVANATGAIRECPRRHAVRDTMEPGTDRFLHPERTGPPSEHQESGLEGILRIVRVT